MTETTDDDHSKYNSDNFKEAFLSEDASDFRLKLCEGILYEESDKVKTLLKSNLMLDLNQIIGSSIPNFEKVNLRSYDFLFFFRKK